MTYHLMGDLDIYDINENLWSTPGFSSKAYLPARRNHIAEIVGNQMLVHGGTGEDNDILGDTYLLSLSPYKWTAAVVCDPASSPNLSGHASALVLPVEYRLNARMNVYKFPEIGFGKIGSNKVYKLYLLFNLMFIFLIFIFIIFQVREKGIYIFGGIDVNGNFSNDLWILRIGKKPLEWIKPISRGNPPLPRYSFTMNYYEDGNFLIVHGGRNDISSDSFALNDTHIFDLHKLEWTEINLTNDNPNFTVFNRCGHSAIIHSKFS